MSARAVKSLSRAAVLLRSATAAPRSFVARPAFVPLARTFASTSRRLGSGEADAQLAASLASEHAYEVESAVSQPKTPEFLQSFRDQGVWEIQDIPGSDSVTVSRKFGNETLKITFQVSDLEDPSEHDPDVEGPIEGVEDDLSSPPFITCSLVITKSATPGAMSIDLEAGEEGFAITNVAMYERALGEAEGAEGDWQRRSKYMGPQYEHLDVAVQEAFDAYLAERGINETLANFVLQYSEHKEQKDYVTWLNEVKGFVEA